MRADKTAGDLFNIDFGDIDFDIADFDLDGIGLMPDSRTRILKPRLDAEILTQTVHFQHAEEFARAVNLESRSRTFAWISGSFILGDLPEALWRARRVGIKNMYIATLSASEENIDSWAGMMRLGMVDHFDLLLSAYFYSHERFDLVPILYERLDIDNKFQVAFGPWHMKLIALETHKGNTILIHGSANTRSSANMEQIMIEVNSGELFDFNRAQIESLAAEFGTVNHKAQNMTRREMQDYFKKQREAMKDD